MGYQNQSCDQTKPDIWCLSAVIVLEQGNQKAIRARMKGSDRTESKQTAAWNIQVQEAPSNVRKDILQES